MNEPPHSDASAAALPKQELLSLSPRSRSRLEELVARWPGVVFTQLPDYSLAFASPRIREMTGLSPAVWSGQPNRFWEVIHEADADYLRKRLAECKEQRGTFRSDFRLRHLVSGKVSYVTEHREAVWDEAGRFLGYEGVWLDLTRERIAEKRLAMAVARAASGTLMGGLGHDLRNALAGVLSSIDLLGGQSGVEASSSPALEILRRGASRANQILQRLSELNRSRLGKPQYADLNQVVAEIADLVGKAIPARIQLKLELATGQLPVHLDAAALRPVLLYLAVNSADRTEGKGEVLYRTRVVSELPAIQPPVGRFPAVPCVCLAVQCAGLGIPEAHLESAFSPDFVAEGQLGDALLAFQLAALFAESARGAATVESIGVADTLVSLWLPQTDLSKDEQLGDDWGAETRKLLLVGRGCERTCYADALRGAGFYVVETNSETRAMELLRGEGNTIQTVVVVSDVEDLAMLGLIAGVQRLGQGHRIALQLGRGDSGGLDFNVLEAVEFVVSAGADPGTLLAKLKAC